VVAHLSTGKIYEKRLTLNTVAEQVHPGLVSPSQVRHMSGLAHAKSNASAFDCGQTILGLRNI